MAITPEEARKELSSQELEDIRIAEEQIDKIIKERFIGETLFIDQKYIKISIFNKRLFPKLVVLYDKSGWILEKYSDQRDGSGIMLTPKG